MKLTPFGVLCIMMAYAVVVLIATTIHIDQRFKAHEAKYHSPTNSIERVSK